MLEKVMRQIQIKELMTDMDVPFGTSGARGLATQMTDTVCAAYTIAFLQKVIKTTGIGRVAIGMDLRPSSPAIAGACAAAVRAAGLAVEFCGILPTPGLAFYSQEKGVPAIMVTGSHVPFDRNGIKFYRADGEISKADETAISSAFVSLPVPLVNHGLPSANINAIQMYAGRFVDFFPDGCLKGMRLGLYEHSSAARDVLREILERLGAEVIGIGRTDGFVPVDTEAVSAEDQAQGREWAKKYGFDAILSTDGDGDRPLFADETGTWMRGDVVGLLCARYLGATAVVTPVSCNTAIERCGAIEKVIRTRIGSPYVIDAMEKAVADGDALVVGFEANGGFLLGSRALMGGREIGALPTRDAVLPMLCLLVAANERGKAVSSLASDLPKRYTASDRIKGEIIL